jgi:hypothetical protein
MNGPWVKSLLLAVVVGCGGNGPGGPSNAGEVNIGLNNQTGRTIVVTIVNGTKWNSGPISVNNGAYVTDEFGPTVAGDAIAVSATTNDGNPVLTGVAVTCRPLANIIGTSVYGQINFSVLAGAISISCAPTPDGTWQ